MDIRKDIACRAASFKQLPQPLMLDSGLPNHWVFGFTNARNCGDCEFVFATNPRSGATGYAGPVPISCLETPEKRAEGAVRILLDLFVQGQQWIPYTWSTPETELKSDMEKVLREFKLPASLQVIGFPTDPHAVMYYHVLHICYSAPPRDLNKDEDHGKIKSTRLRPVCKNCGKPEFQNGFNMLYCQRCVFDGYCSRACQKEDWPRHKHVCNERDSHINIIVFFTTRAKFYPKAQKLAAKMNIDLPVDYDAPPKLLPVLRRMIMTGNDIAENFEALFGPFWQAPLGDCVQDLRVHLKLEPAPGSPFQKHYARIDTLLKQPQPPANMNPPTIPEMQDILAIRKVQDHVREILGGRKRLTQRQFISVIENTGRPQLSGLLTYYMAVNCMGPEEMEIPEEELSYMEDLAKRIEGKS
ncbi:hypothetical protein K470DRAFT_279321 [Piedraia hortae CBS 480.64]|uniref:MYND-type domain-containing protein n=1 Tax=Piedraia hortae CBS 480.64 TaxID=1314780 RepID=A0A6A7BRN3_9PEZI|nr:hypothetical protein K470DRAFT_279321 [Piedraia hortae CBS 480.64]